MTVLLAIVVGGLYASGLFLLLRRSIVKLAFGLVLLGHGTNLLILTAGGVVRGRPPLIPRGGEVFHAPPADPMAQALILTAIVISFAVVAFAVVLLHRVHRTMGSDDIDSLESTDP
ncbi:cation:proton antiporter [Sorangium cellulosum]|uniref:Cation:proton antiporter n=1 Tax=Sorangium cellulosum TaxID=56 RepID=A0A150TL69_SORCE|nr:cation:proton antiporter [Sorangium cellulosum]